MCIISSIFNKRMPEKVERIKTFDKIYSEILMIKFGINIKIRKSTLAKRSEKSMETGKMGLQVCTRAKGKENPGETSAPTVSSTCEARI